MHYCASTHQTSLVKVKALNQEHKAQRKGGRLFRTYSSEKKQVRPREERWTFQKKKREEEMDRANQTDLGPVYLLPTLNFGTIQKEDFSSHQTCGTCM